MAAKPEVSLKPSEPDQVDSYMRKLKHPLADIVAALRREILSAHDEIGEEIKWNAPTFFYTGPMKPFNPKEYKRYVIVFNLYRKDCIRLVFPSGARIGDTSGLLEGDYADGRRLALFSNAADVQSRKGALKKAVRKWVALLDRECEPPTRDARAAGV